MQNTINNVVWLMKLANCVLFVTRRHTHTQTYKHKHKYRNLENYVIVAV